MRLPRSFFKLEAASMLAYALAPALLGLLIVLLVRALR